MSRLLRLVLIVVVLGTVAVAAIAFLGDRRRPAPGPVARPSPIPTPAFSPTPITLAQAQRVAFPGGMRDGRIVYDEGKLVETPFGPVLVNPGTIPDAAHAEGGAVAIHYLRQDATGLHVTRALPLAIESGSSGQFMEWRIDNRFGSLPVVYVVGGGTWQGYSCVMATLTELRPDGPAQLAAIELMASNEGAVPPEESEATAGKIVDVVPGRSFVVRYTGTRNFDARYVRRGDRYVPERGQTDTLGGC